MKKLVALGLLLSMLFVLCSCGANTIQITPETIIGKWSTSGEATPHSDAYHHWIVFKRDGTYEEYLTYTDPFDGIDSRGPSTGTYEVKGDMVRIYFDDLVGDEHYYDVQIIVENGKLTLSGSNIGGYVKEN